MLKPLSNRVVIDITPPEVKTESGLIIPNAAQEQLPEGIIVAIGPGKKDEPMVVEVGMHVRYAPHSGQEIILDGRTYVILRQPNIQGILD